MTLYEAFQIQDKYLTETWSVDNGFIRALYGFYRACIQNLLLPTADINAVTLPMFCLGNNTNKIVLGHINTPEHPNKGIDLCRIGPLQDKNLPTLLDEITVERAEAYQIDRGTMPITPLMQQTLLVDYLLRSCVCYVESFKGNIPQKFLATRNIDLLRFLVREEKLMLNKNLEDAKEYAKFKAKTIPLAHEAIKAGAIQFIKLEGTGKSLSQLKLVAPRNETYLANSNLQITPLFMIDLLSQGITNRLKHGMLEIVFLKDNLVRRSIISTLNVNEATRAFQGNRERAITVIDNANLNAVARGYISIPELLLPDSDTTGCRAMSFRIVDIKSVAPNFVNQFLTVDLENVLPQFEAYLNQHAKTPDLIYTIAQLVEMKMGKLSAPALLANVEEYRQKCNEYVASIRKIPEQTVILNLMSWLGTCLLVDKTQTMRNLHLLMVENPMLFPRYTGKRVTTNEVKWTAGI